MDQELIIKNLGHVHDEHLNQITLIHKKIFFTTQEDAQPYRNAPLDKLTKSTHFNTNTLESQTLNRLNEIQDALKMCSTHLLSDSESTEKTISTETYTEFCNLHTEFLGRLRRFELDLNKEGSGIDPLTGLRSQSIMIEDLTRELSACARRGDYLGLALGRIDRLKDIEEKFSAPEQKSIISFVSDIIKKNMRLYDDGYRYSTNLFILCFKHTDQLGAVSAIERFIRMLSESQDTAPSNQFKKKLGHEISLTYSVAKLEVGANILELIHELEKDVANHPDDISEVLEYQDVSNLQKYLQTVDLPE